MDCPSCHRRTPRSGRACVHCGTPLRGAVRGKPAPAGKGVVVEAAPRPEELAPTGAGPQDEEMRLSYGPGMPAGIWLRMASGAVDLVGLALVFMLIDSAVSSIGSSFFSVESGEITGTERAVALLLVVGVPMAYYTLTVGRWGQTMGKRVLRVKVTTPDGGKVTYRQAFIRFWASLLSILLLFTGITMIPFDPEKKGLHDIIARTRVVTL